MMLRILLTIIIAGAVGLGGCKKKEPTVGEKMDQMKKEADKTADDMADQAKEAADDAKQAGEDRAEETQ